MPCLIIPSFSRPTKPTIYYNSLQQHSPLIVLREGEPSTEEDAQASTHGPSRISSKFQGITDSSFAPSADGALPRTLLRALSLFRYSTDSTTTPVRPSPPKCSLCPPTQHGVWKTVLHIWFASLGRKTLYQQQCRVRQILQARREASELGSLLFVNDKRNSRVLRENSRASFAKKKDTLTRVLAIRTKQ